MEGIAMKSGRRLLGIGCRAAVAVLVLTSLLRADLVDIRWPSSVVPSSTFLTSGKAIGKPDGDPALFSGPPVTLTCGGFVTETYDLAALAGLLGVSVSDVARSDFIAFDGNAPPLGFETSKWSFDDGTSPVFDVDYLNGGALPPGVVATGIVSSAQYQAFFGPPSAPGDFAFLLFDVSLKVDTMAPGFKVLVTAAGGPDPLTPELDALGVIGAKAFIRGNCNDRDNTNLTDVIFHLNALFTGGPAPDCADACDANDDGVLDLTDGVYLLTWLFLGGSPPKAPVGACGPDPTHADALNCLSFSLCP